MCYMCVNITKNFSNKFICFLFQTWSDIIYNTVAYMANPTSSIKLLIPSMCSSESPGTTLLSRRRRKLPTALRIFCIHSIYNVRYVAMVRLETFSGVGVEVEVAMIVMMVCTVDRRSAARRHALYYLPGHKNAISLFVWDEILPIDIRMHLIVNPENPCSEFVTSRNGVAPSCVAYERRLGNL